MKIVSIKIGSAWYRASAVIGEFFHDKTPIKIGNLRPQTQALIFKRHNKYGI